MTFYPPVETSELKKQSPRVRGTELPEEYPKNPLATIDTLFDGMFDDYIRLEHDVHLENKENTLAALHHDIRFFVDGTFQHKDSLERKGNRRETLEERQEHFFEEGMRRARAKYLVEHPEEETSQEEALQPGHISASEYDAQPEVTNRFKKIVKRLGATSFGSKLVGKFHSGEIKLPESVTHSSVETENSEN